MSNIKTKYHPEDWCEEKHDCEDQCYCEKKHNDNPDDKDRCDCEKKHNDKLDDKDLCDCEKKPDDKLDDKNQSDCEKKLDAKLDGKPQCDFEKKLDAKPDDKDRCNCEKKHNDKDQCVYEKKPADKPDVKDQYDFEKKQFHDHEFEGSTRKAELDEALHNHRFAGVSGPAIVVPGGHIHKVKSRTDFFDHLHYFEAISGLQVPVGNGSHVHFIKTITSVNDFHSHELVFATLINAPIFENKNSINTEIK